MNSRTTTLTAGSNTSAVITDLPHQLNHIGLHVTSSSLDDLIARAVKHRWSPRILLEEIVRAESQDRARRSLERRLRNARLGRFKPIADFDWNWPTKIDRSLIEAAFSLDFISEGRNLILLGANGFVFLQGRY